ncbi:MAG: 4-(cytidine 5'-diphospho)-2-C-methyl-D-erythritol kinase, partial [Pseudomonadota bacterium]
MSSSIQCPVKINLALQVGEVQSDGYHPVDSLCVFMAGGDRLTLSPPSTERFTLQLLGPYGKALEETISQNLILKAARLYAKATSVPVVDFHLYKSVPPASGIGGGTANGAAALYLLNQQAAVPLSLSALVSLSEKLGADGPVCMQRFLSSAQSLRVKGIGEVVGTGPKLPPLFMCLANGGRAVSTAKVFQRFDEKAPASPFSLTLPQRISSYHELAGLLAGTRNDLRAPAFSVAPDILETENRMKAQPGCIFARMSGSGGTVFGLFPSSIAAKRARQ